MALVTSLIGLMRRQDRGAAILGLVLSGLMMAFLFGFPLIMRLCR